MQLSIKEEIIASYEMLIENCQNEIRRNKDVNKNFKLIREYKKILKEVEKKCESEYEKVEQELERVSKISYNNIYSNLDEIRKNTEEFKIEKV